MSINFESELVDPKNWSKDDEVYLLASMLNNKPVGIDKHLQMSIIWSRFLFHSKKSVSSEILWKKLSSWYNLKYFDENEAVPFNMAEEDFQLPAKVIPEPYLKTLSEEDRKYVDFSGTHDKFISVLNIDEEDSEVKSHWKLKGSEKMKWFENPSQSKSIGEKPTKKSDFKAKSFEMNESSNDSTNGTPRVIRQYGKAGEVSSGTILTVGIPPPLMDELDDNAMEVDPVKEEPSGFKKVPKTTDNKAGEEKATKTKRKRVTKKEDLSATTPDEVEGATPAKQLSRAAKSVEPATSVTRLRKASIASHEASSGTETEKESTTANDETPRNVRRRFSQRVSSTSESKSDPPKPSESSNKSDTKRKSVSRR